MSCMISPVVVMATWSAFSGGIWVTGRRVLACCCRRRWRACCRFWALVRLDFFIVTRLLQGSRLLDTESIRGMVSGAAWAYRHAWMIRLDRTGRQTLAHLDDKGDAILYRRGMEYRARHHASRERLPHGRQETPNTASTAQAVFRISCSLAADL